MILNHINWKTNLPCFGFLFVDGVTIHGTRYKCSFCSKVFVIDSNGNVVL
ncbi:MAG: hypothetical protein MJ179_11310 [Treponema sp.]|nr:hypothetical protein [Treponema sp.]